MLKNTTSIVMLLFAAGASLCAQTATARITGTVTDSSGAVVPGVVITLLNEATGQSLEAQTNDSGIYTISFINPGTYNFSATAPSFRRYLRTMALLTGQVMQVDFSLEVGQTTESVTVTGGAPLVQSATSSINTVIENSFIRNMPVESNHTVGLVRLLPGVVFMSEQTFEDHMNFSVGGGPGRSGEYQLDGGNVTSNVLGGHSIEFNPPVDAVQEMKVEVNGYPAEYGRSTGGVVSMTTKSGTNQFHGTLYENFRNNALDARSFFAPSVAPRKYNVFGGVLGGPIRRDKTFFLFSAEATRRVDGATRIYSFPSAAEVAGDFSAVPGTLIDPSTRTPFPGKIVPPSRMDPVGVKLAGNYTAPNRAGRANNFVANASNYTPSIIYLAKVDHQFSDRDRISFRFVNKSATENRSSAIPNRSVDPNAQIADYDLININPSWFHTFNPSLFNETRFTYSDNRGNFPQFEEFGVAGQVGLTGVAPTGVPEVIVLGLTNLGRGTQWRSLTPRTTITAADSLTFFRGKHTFKAGGEWRYSANGDTSGTSMSGQLRFNDVATGAGFSLAALLLGLPNQVAVATADSQTRSDYVAFYIQDDWKVNTRLTLNLGLRYDFDTPRWEKENRQSGFDPVAINPVSGTPGVITFAGLNGASKYAHNTDKNNLGPRVGFAYRAPKDLVVRGAFGLVYGSLYDAALTRSFAASFGDVRSFTSPDNGLTPALLLRNGVPALPPVNRGPAFGAVPVGSRVVINPDFLAQNHQNPYSLHFNFNIQKQLTNTTLASIEYLGNMTHRIGGDGAANINEVRPELRGATQDQRLRPFPQFGDVLWRAPSWGNATYHALNLKMEKRFSSGMNLLGTYTWSKAIQDLPQGRELTGATAVGMQSYYARHLDKGLSGNDMRHRMTTSFVYELPVGTGKAIAVRNPVLNMIFGGWSTGMIAELRSGTPYSVYEQTNRLNAFSPGQRSSIVSDPDLPTNRPRAQLVRGWFDVNAYAFPGAGVLGNASRSPGTGPGFMNFDASLLKDFHFSEKRFLQFRSQFYNLFNRANFANPNGSRGNPAFGTIAGVMNDGRFIQLTLRLVF